jgi:tRNA-splicing ligase RtcB
MVLAELVRDSFAQVFACDQSRLVVEVPHNVVLREHGMNIHRKGATPAREGGLALIPGSMGDYSYVATGMGNPDWLWSRSHGAGRSVRRQAMRTMRPAPGGNEMALCVYSGAALALGGLLYLAVEHPGRRLRERLCNRQGRLTLLAK